MVLNRRIVERATIVVALVLCISLSWANSIVFGPIRLVGAQSPSKGLLLFDTSHGVWSDPYHGKFTVSDGYSTLAGALREEGFEVAEIKAGPIRPSTLANATVLVIVYLESGLGKEESAAIQSFVQNGGGLLILGDCNYNYGTGEYAGLNALSHNFGITFNDDTVLDPDDSTPTRPKKIIIHEFAEHEITFATGSILYVWGSSLSLQSSARAIAFTDQDSWGDRNRDDIQQHSEARGPLPVVAVSEYGQGRVLAIGEKRLFTSLQLANSIPQSAILYGIGFDTLQFARKAFFWLAHAQKQGIIPLEEGKVQATIPRDVYEIYQDRIDSTLTLLNKADELLSQLYGKKFDKIAWEVIPPNSRPNDPHTVDATMSRNKIVTRTYTFSSNFQNEADYVGMMLHEYTHSFNHFHESYLVTSWLDEGLAYAVPVLIMPRLGFGQLASQLDEGLRHSADRYIENRYNTVLSWNYTSFEQRGPTYGFAYYVVKSIVEKEGWEVFESMFRLLELEGYPLTKAEDQTNGQIDFVAHANMLIQRLVILSGDSALLANFKEWHFPVASKTESVVSNALGEAPSVKVVKSVDKIAEKSNEEVQAFLEISNVGKTSLPNVEVLDSIPLNLRLTSGSLTWKGTLVPGQIAQLSYAMQVSIAGRYQLPTAIGFYPDASGKFHVTRSSPGSYQMTTSTTATETSAAATTETITSPMTLHTETVLSTQTRETVLAPYGLLTETVVLVGLTFMILAIVGAFYLRRRRK